MDEYILDHENWNPMTPPDVLLLAQRFVIALGNYADVHEVVASFKDGWITFSVEDLELPVSIELLKDDDGLLYAAKYFARNIEFEFKAERPCRT